MGQLKAIIFDVDGTLAETERDGHRLAFNQAFSEAGLPWQWSAEFYGKLLEVSGGKERLLSYVRQYHPQFEPPVELAVWAAQLHRQKTKYYRQLLLEGSIPLRLGVERLIAEARGKDVRLAIATTSALPNAMALLEKFFHPTVFELIAAGDIVAQKKPAPDIYHYVIEQMHVSPRECIVIEDSQAGVQAATQAGLPTLVTQHEYTQNQDFPGAIAVLSDLGEPDSPFEVIRGDLGSFTYTTLDTLAFLQQQAVGNGQKGNG
ncbi:HAD-IA family hydrolase [Roseofilum sp. BLCC_M91]|uniref:HAD-IA family hydrolase n=1 Tax=Roseofilum halophilum BLCC-M91 TaxID=3022259 RepID=A0ABT7BQ23_9CYAN|nr:HAD-IA family hydrolase [Roseofilum halophilum]MDJ1180817.1 HAD-IA family hydrolase [Roseofilum halophilum BLCC-M91]